MEYRLEYYIAIIAIHMDLMDFVDITLNKKCQTNKKSILYSSIYVKFDSRQSYDDGSQKVVTCGRGSRIGKTQEGSVRMLVMFHVGW